MKNNKTPLLSMRAQVITSSFSRAKRVFQLPQGDKEKSWWKQEEKRTNKDGEIGCEKEVGHLLALCFRVSSSPPFNSFFSSSPLLLSVLSFLASVAPPSFFNLAHMKLFIQLIQQPNKSSSQCHASLNFASNAFSFIQSKLIYLIMYH